MRLIRTDNAEQLGTDIRQVALWEIQNHWISRPMRQETYWIGKIRLSSSLKLCHKATKSHIGYGSGDVPIFLSPLVWRTHNIKRSQSFFYLHLTREPATETHVDSDVKLDPDCVSSCKRLNSYKTLFLFLSPSFFFIRDTSMSVRWYNWPRRQSTDVIFSRPAE